MFIIRQTVSESFKLGYLIIFGNSYLIQDLKNLEYFLASVWCKAGIRESMRLLSLTLLLWSKFLLPLELVIMELLIFQPNNTIQKSSSLYTNLCGHYPSASCSQSGSLLTRNCQPYLQRKRPLHPLWNWFALPLRDSFGSYPLYAN